MQAPNPPALYRFGVFEVDLAARQIRKAGREIHLQEQPLRLLTLLLERPNELRTREELQQLLWPNETFVEFDDGLNTAIQKIRQVLGDEARNPRFVETVPRQGYRFIAPVHHTPLELQPAEVPQPKNRKPIVVMALLAGAALGWFAPHFTNPSPAPPMRLSITPPAGVELRPGIRGGSAISPDGRMIVFAGSRDGKQMLWVRGINSSGARELPGTENAILPFWSPDGHAIGFLAAGQLHRIDLSGGLPADLASVVRPTRGAWMENGDILFANGTGNPIQRVKATGGAVSSAAPAGPRGSAWPYPIPGTDRFLYYNNTARGIEISNGGASSLVNNANSGGLYAPPHNGHPGYLLWLKGTTLVAQPFDPAAAKLTGEAAPVAEDVGFTDGWRYADLSLSANGTLLYGPGTTVKSRLAWVRRDGTIAGFVAEPDWIRSVRLSADGRRALIERGMVRALWVYGFERNVQTRATFEKDGSGWPVWSPDGTQFAYSGDRDGKIGLYSRKASGGPEQRLVDAEFDQYPYDWSRDGKFLIYCEVNPQSKLDLWLLPLAGESKPRVFLRTPFSEDSPRFSPDGHWVVYVSDESGKNEVYVTSFPAAEGKWQISTAGGAYPRWSNDGREIFYESSDGQMMAVPVLGRPGKFESSKPKRLFPHPLPGRHFEVGPQGDRFLMMVTAEGHGRNELTVFLNWQSALRH
ncbi:MAG: PD40 domain-containing protein [Acidobacteria bacterium]|nr:PD40 domain-containing protein [Acidobacteriota bacterium]